MKQENIFRFISQIIWNIRLNAVSLHSKTSRGGAEVARQAHNLEVIGSNPVSATKGKAIEYSVAFLF